MLDEPPCLGLTLEEPEFDCFSQRPFGARFVVRELVFGSLPLAERFAVVASSSSGLGFLPRGTTEPQLVLLGTDGRNYIAHAWVDVARLTTGGWAIPVADHADGIAVLPCDGTSLVRPLEFAAPKPEVDAERFDERELAELSATEGIEVDGGRIYVGRGIAVDDLRRAIPSDLERAHEWREIQPDDCVIAGR